MRCAIAKPIKYRLTVNIEGPIIDRMNIPYTLSELHERGLTQSQIAAELGCSQSTISEMSTGKVGTTRPSYKIVSGLQTLAAKHGITEPASP